MEEFEAEAWDVVVHRCLRAHQCQNDWRNGATVPASVTVEEYPLATLNFNPTPPVTLNFDPTPLVTLNFNPTARATASAAATSATGSATGSATVNAVAVATVSC